MLEDSGLSLDDVRDVVFHTDAAGRYTFLNSSWEIVTGFSRKESLGRSFLEFVHPHDREHNKDMFLPLIRRDKEHCLHEIRHLTKEGGFCWIEVHARLTTDGTDVSGTTGTLRDVTERCNQTAALRDAEQRLLLGMKASNTGFFEWDLEAGELRHDARFHNWPQVPEVVRGSLEEVVAVIAHEEDRACLEASVRCVLTGQTDEVLIEHRRPLHAGVARWVRVSGSVVERDGLLRPRRLCGTMTDVTQVHMLQDRLLAATRLASVGTLAAGVAHEINNPLAWVASNISHVLASLSEPGSPADQEPERTELRQMLAEAQLGVERIAAIVRAMRSLGGPALQKEAALVDVRAELLSALLMVRNQIVQRARLEVCVPNELPWVNARTNELGRVFLNLLVNAAQAIPEGQADRNKVTVLARPSGDRLIVEIADTGAGISKELRERIFEAFFTTRPAGVGTGLGLTIARSIVDGAGGTIELDSEVGCGSTFRVLLPAAAEDGTPAPGPTIRWG